MSAAPPPETPARKSIVESALSSARDVAFVASIFLIFAGVAFRERYFANFDMPTSAAEESIYLILLSAYSVLVENWIACCVAVLVVALLLLVLSQLLRLARAPERVRRGSFVGMASILVIAGFIGLASIAEKTADDHASKVRERFLIGARVHLKPSEAAAYPQKKLLDATALSIIGETSDDVFVIYQPPPISRFPDILPDSTIYEIPRDAIAYVESDLVAASEEKP